MRLRRMHRMPNDALLRLTRRLTTGGTPAPSWLAAALPALVVGAAILGAALLASDQYRDGLVWASAAAIGLFFMNLAGLAQPLGSRTADPYPAPPSNARSANVRRPVLAVTLIAVIIASVMAARESNGLLPMLPWLISVVALCFVFRDGGPRAYARYDWLVAGGLLIVALATRTVLLERVPPGIHGDEAEWGLWALRLLGGEVPPFAFVWLGYPGTTFAPYSLTLYLFGPTLGAVRLGSAIAGAFAVPGVYLVARQTFERGPSLIAALFFLLNVANFHFSRLGVSNIEGVPVALLGAANLLAVAARPERLRSWCLLGISIGLSLEVYLTALVWPIIAALTLAPALLGLVRSGQSAQVRSGMTAAALAALVTAAPLLVWTSMHPGAMSQRASSLTVWSKQGGTHAAKSYGLQQGDTAGILKIQLQRSLAALHVQGDTSLHFASRHALFDPVCGVAILLGLASLLFSWRETMSRLLLTWLALTLIFGAVILVDPPFAPRLVLLLPVGCLVGAAGIYQAWASMLVRWAPPGRAATLAGILSVCIGAALGFGYYFGDYWRTAPSGRITALARYVQSAQDRSTFYFVGLDEPTDYATFRFLAPRAEILRWDPDQSLPPSGHHQAKAFLMPMPPDLASSGAAEHVSSRYPEHEEKFLTDAGGAAVVRVWEVGSGKSPGVQR